MLELPAQAATVRIDRLRLVGGRVCVLERICLPGRLFSGFERRELPNNLYEYYATSYGVTIGRATERLKAVAADAAAAAHLEVAEGEPLLHIDRLAYALDGRLAEWRVALCRTDGLHYRSDWR